MTKMALMGILSIHPEQRDAFLAEMKDHKAKTLASQPGCLQFEFHITDDDPNQVLLYEVYADAAAIAAHRENPQWHKYRATTADMVADRTVGEWIVL